jgi:penicillin-binding protein 1C
LAAAQARLMTRLRAAHGEPPNELDADFNLEPTSIPREAPHLARRRLREDPKSLTVSTTLDRGQQRVVEQSIADFLERWRPQGLRNAAAVLLHVPSRGIRACVGSAGFHNVGISGQVDGTRAGRSPGSTLKPFIYALALDAGLMQPQTLLDDAPRRFAGYNPENSDRNFLGPIAASEALRLSRNVPAVELAWRLPVGGLETFLRSSGIRLPPHQGLALAIGATEMTLEDLAGLYAELADPKHGRVSPSACWLTLDALLSHEAGAPPGLSCKTGTSNGFRDAWACGVIGEWVLCVWIGHFDGHGMPGLFARETAAPLLWQTVTRLKLPAKNRDEVRPPEVTRVSVCAVSGDLAGKHCPHCREGWFIGGVSPITSCQVHQKIGDAVVEVWSAERLEQFRKAGFPRAATALSRPQQPAQAAVSGPPPRILSPQSTLTYYIQANAPQQSRLLLQASAAPGIQQIHWFAGNRYLGASPPAEPLPWQPLAGDYEIQAMDDAGRVSTAKISVRLAVGK